MATQLISKKPTSYLDVLKQKEQEKKKINLFDFSDVQQTQPTQTKQMNFGQPVSQRHVTNFADYQSSLPKQQPITQKSSGFSLFPTANAMETQPEKYLSKQRVKEIIDGRPEGVQPMEIFSQLEEKGYIMEGYNDTQKPQDINQMGLLQEGGQRLSNLGTKLGERAGKFGEAFTKERSQNPFVAGLQNIGAGIGAVGQIAGGIGDIAFEGLAYVTPDIVKETLTGGAKKAWENTPETIKQTAINAIKVGGEEYKQFKQNNPFLADTLEGSLNIASLAPIGYGGKVAGKGIEKTGEVLTKGGKQVISKLTPDLSKTASKVSTKANRFNAVDEEKFIKTTGQTPGEFAVERGMTEVGDKAVEKATQNYLTSMKQADDAFEQIGGNFKYTGKGNDPIKLSLDDLEKRGINTEAEFLPRIQELKAKYEKEGLTFPEINEVKREYSNNFKYGFEDRNSEALARSTNIQNRLREWQLSKADEMGVSNIRDINKNTQAWKLYADALEKKLNRSGANNAVGITDWIALSGGNATNVALFLGKKLGTSDKAKELLIKTLGKQTKDAIITPNVNKPQIKGLLPKGPVITPAPEFKSGIKVTPATIQPNVKTQKALPPGKVVTPQTSEKGVIQESKIPLKNTKTGLNRASEGAQNYDLAKQSIKDYDNVKDLEELRGDIKTLGLAREKELLQELDNKILGLKEMDNIEGSIGDKLYSEYGDDLINSFKVLYKNEIRNKTRGGADKYSKVEFQNTPAFTKFKDSVNEYIGKNPWNDKTTQEIYDEIKDQLTNINKVKEINKPILSPNKTKYGTNSNIPSNMNNARTDKLLKPNQPTNVSNKPLQKTSKTGREVLKKILPSNFKEKAQDIVENLAEKTGGKKSFMGNEGIGADKPKLLKPIDKGLIEEAKKYKSFDDYLRKGILDKEKTDYLYKKFSNSDNKKEVIGTVRQFIKNDYLKNNLSEITKDTDIIVDNVYLDKLSDKSGITVMAGYMPGKIKGQPGTIYIRPNTSIKEILEEIMHSERYSKGRLFDMKGYTENYSDIGFEKSAKKGGEFYYNKLKQIYEQAHKAK